MISNTPTVTKKKITKDNTKNIAYLPISPLPIKYGLTNISKNTSANWECAKLKAQSLK
jgi:hypothetical protein